MQNKPNFRNAKMDLTSYEHRDYEHESPFAFGQNKPNFEPTAPTDNSSSFLASHQLRTPFSNRCAQSRTNFFETLQKLQKIACFPHIFSFFLTFSQVFARFQHFSPPISAFMHAFLPPKPHSKPKNQPKCEFPTPNLGAQSAYDESLTDSICPLLQPETTCPI